MSTSGERASRREPDGVRDLRVAGRARVMRQQERYVYALRFERLPPSTRAALQALAAHQPTQEQAQPQA